MKLTGAEHLTASIILRMSIRRCLNAPLKNYQAAEKLPDLSSVYKHDRVRGDAQPLAGKAEMLFGGGLNAY